MGNNNLLLQEGIRRFSNNRILSRSLWYRAYNNSLLIKIIMNRDFFYLSTHREGDAIRFRS